MAAEVEAIKEQLAGTRRRLLRAIEGVTEEQFRRRPDVTPSDASPWCIAEVLAHLLAYERIEAERIALALERDGAEIVPSPPEWHDETARAGRRVPVPQIIHGLLASRRAIEQLLERAAGTEGSLDRAVTHPRRDRDTIRWMAREKLIDHEAEHAAQIEALRPAVGAPPLLEPGPAPAGQ